MTVTKKTKVGFLFACLLVLLVGIAYFAAEWPGKSDRDLSWFIDNDKVADAVVHALAAPRPRTRYIVGADARANVAMARWLPDRVRDALLTWAMGLPRRAPDEA